VSVHRLRVTAPRGPEPRPARGRKQVARP
jgi:hypothetical protein